MNDVYLLFLGTERLTSFVKHIETWLTQPMDPEKKSLNFIFPTKYVIPKSLKFSHWLSEMVYGCIRFHGGRNDPELIRMMPSL